MPTRLQTTPHMMFLFISPQFCVGLPSHKTSRLCSCLSLVVNVILPTWGSDGDLPTEDFHLISSCPCWAYTSCQSKASFAALTQRDVTTLHPLARRQKCISLVTSTDYLVDREFHTINDNHPDGPLLTNLSVRLVGLN